jgi:hypothetical protein
VRQSYFLFFGRLDFHRIAFQERLVELFGGFVALGVEPFAAHLITYLGERGQATFRALGKKNEMRAIAGGHRALPVTRRQCGKGEGELVAEYLFDLRERGILEGRGEKKRIAERTQVRIGPDALQLREKASFVRSEIGGMPLGIEIDLSEREKRLGLEQVRISLQKSLQIGIGGFDASREIVREKFEFLPEAAADDGVVAIEAHGQGFAISRFFANIVPNLAAEFLLRGMPLPGSRETRDDIFQSALGDDNLAGFIGSVSGNETVGREDGGPQQNKV